VCWGYLDGHANTTDIGHHLCQKHLAKLPSADLVLEHNVAPLQLLWRKVALFTFEHFGKTYAGVPCSFCSGLHAIYDGTVVCGQHLLSSRISPDKPTHHTQKHGDNRERHDNRSECAGGST